MSLCGGRFVKGVEKNQPGGFDPIGVQRKTIFQKLKKQGAANVCSRIGVPENNGFGIITPICEL